MKAVTFLRDHALGLRRTSFFLLVPVSTLNSWDKGFDDHMQPIIVPDKRGKGSKVTLDMIRTITSVAGQQMAKGHRIRLQSFSRMLKTEMNISLSSKTVGDILTANDLRSPKTRRKRPAFYQKLRQEIPNGLISVDGSEIKIYIDDQIIKLNLEMAVDTNSFAHTAFSLAKEESSEEFIKVLKNHLQQWGVPLGVVSDSGGANLSDASLEFLHSHNIMIVPAGPANPKGNGTIEGAFNLLKSTIGTIHLNTSSLENLAKSVLQTIVSVYIKMRNRLSLNGRIKSPAECMTETVSEKAKIDLKQKLQHQIDLKKGTTEDHQKLELLHSLIKTMQIPVEMGVINRAKKSITYFSMKAILESERAFVKAVNRKKERLSLAYFFGILKRIQQEQDEQAYKSHCQARYNYAELKKQMIDQEAKQDAHRSSTVQDIIKILTSAVTIRAIKIKNVALRRAKEWTEELMKTTKHAGTLRKKFENSLTEMSQLEPSVKEKILEHVDNLLNQKTCGKSVTHFS